MIEIGFVFILWSVKGNHRDKEGDKSQEGARWQRDAESPCTQRKGSGVGEGVSGPGQGHQQRLWRLSSTAHLL